jgi:HSP20 family protein
MLPAVQNHPAFSPVASAPINRLAPLFGRMIGEDGGFQNPMWSRAPLAMWEDDDHIWIDAELPGVAATDVDVTVHQGVLHICGQRKQEEGRRYLLNRCWSGPFQWTINLPEALDTESVQATLKDGILHVRLAKAAEAKPKKIPITSS